MLTFALSSVGQFHYNRSISFTANYSNRATVCPDFRYSRGFSLRSSWAPHQSLLVGGLYLEIQEHLTLIRSCWILLCLREWASSLCTSIMVQSDGGVRTSAACPSSQPFSHLADPNRHDQTDPTIFLRSHASDNISATALVEGKAENNH